MTVGIFAPMGQDTTFRSILAVGFLAVITIGLYHRLRSQATRETLDRRQEGLFILATLRPLGLAYWLGFFAYMANPTWMDWSSVPLPMWLRWSGVGGCVAGAALFIWTLRSLGPNLTDTVVTRQAHTLVTGGPYRWVRHPFYDAAVLLIVAIALIAANWFLLLTGLLVFGLLVVRTRTEEEKLLARFGDEYRTYMTRTGRFVPGTSARSFRR
jgi:protein-S-isoprenylcysteine O-methyltransferase Ste14